PFPNTMSVTARLTLASRVTVFPNPMTNTFARSPTHGGCGGGCRSSTTGELTGRGRAAHPILTTPEKRTKEKRSTDICLTFILPLFLAFIERESHLLRETQ